MVKVKICGLTSPEDAKMARDLGADLVGVIVNVTVSTPREISSGKAEDILDSVRDQADTVVVTMPETLEEVNNLADRLDPDYLQIHSSLSPSKLLQIKRETGRKIIGVLSIPQNPNNSGDVISRAKEIEEVSDFVLLDTKSNGGGGTGKSHDWSMSSVINEGLNTPIILAGGLNPSNVQRALEKVNPFGVDVSSGVETEPGKKDPDLLKEFIEKAGE
ncbi:hypothetical protein AKJ53_01605 [candidate division MSBL1 archaeon SCGC-AAA382F02]|uniref:N-(5'-phosphoribosyl)anthranilate isomerase n=1 Tax=candidate division MSBL1 archaeon SCGC-AAA382F02 TaxID=1698282 RepID=A0A133VHR2_9EURY|nr:hypothetical protein AKJ53_01605 [candidate division MSBL1 archaeon SCGC-AAA382F02]